MMDSVTAAARRAAFRTAQPSTHELMRQAGKVLGRDLFDEVEEHGRYRGPFADFFDQAFGGGHQ